MLILSQKLCLLGSTIFKVPLLNWYYCRHPSLKVSKPTNKHTNKIQVLRSLDKNWNISISGTPLTTVSLHTVARDWHYFMPRLTIKFNERAPIYWTRQLLHEPDWWMKPFYFEYCSTESNKIKWCEIDYQMNLHICTYVLKTGLD